MDIHDGRFTAEIEGDFVVFLIGMRFNQPLKIHKWLPVARAMPRMLGVIDRHPELGCLGYQQWFGRTTILVQYWRDFASLDRFARDRSLPHLEPWRQFNRAVRNSGDVGVWHETFKVRAGEYEAVYANMPAFGLARATDLAPVGRVGQTAAARIGVDPLAEPLSSRTEEPSSDDMATPAQVLHRLTSYEPSRDWDEPIDDARVVQDPAINDLARLPWFNKRYERALPRMTLPRELPPSGATALDVLAGRAHPDPGVADLDQISRLLHLAAGVVRTAQRPYGTYPFRAAGSAGGRFPLELYVAVPSGAASPAGVHWYDPADHALVRVGPPAPGAITFVVTGIPWRTGWRYRERGYRHVFWDAGTMLSQLLAAAESAGLSPRLFTRFPDDAVASLVGADGRHEIPVALVGLGDEQPAVTGSGPGAAGAVDAAPIEFPLVTAAHRAGAQTTLDPAWPSGAVVDVAPVTTAPVDEVILARGSQRLMDGTRTLSRELVQTSMTVAMRGITVPHWVVAHRVEGLEPGLYRWPDLATPVLAGDLRERLHQICLEQALARDAAFVVIGTAVVAALNDRQYREAQLASGLVEGRLHLLAYALGASASGMTFLDSEIAGLLGEALDGMLFTCVGVPEYASAPGGPPGRPTAVYTVAPR